MTRVMHAGLIFRADDDGRVYCENDGTQIGMATDYDALVAAIDAHMDAAHHD